MDRKTKKIFAEQMSEIAVELQTLSTRLYELGEDLYALAGTYNAVILETKKEEKEAKEAEGIQPGQGKARNKTRIEMKMRERLKMREFNDDET